MYFMKYTFLNITMNACISHTFIVKKSAAVFFTQLAEPELQKLLCADMETRLVQLKSRLTNLRAESEEVWKTLETAESTLLDMLTAKDYDCSGYFGENAVPASKPPETVSIKLRADRHETEEFYLSVSTEILSVLDSNEFFGY